MKKGSTQSTLLTCLLLSGIAAIVSSCQDYDPSGEQHVQDVAYTHEFERQFGDIDPNQNWDLFGQLARKRHAITRADQYVNQVSVVDAGSDEYITITEEDTKQFTKVLPESPVYGSQLTSVSMTNLGRVNQDFVAKDHTFTLAPVFWYTGSSTNVLGIYWYTDDENNADVTIMGADGELYWLVRKEIMTGKTHLYYTNPNGNVNEIPTVWSQNDKAPQSSGHVFDRYNATNLISHPIKVTVPEEIPFFGFYVTNNLGTRYSESKLNQRLTKSGFTDVQPCFAATFNIQKDIDASSSDDKQYLCFEDNFDQNETDFDLNDLVFAIGGLDDNSIIDRSTVNESAVLVCEDLMEYDFDFNDVALGLNYTEEIDREYIWDEQNAIYKLDEENTTIIRSLQVTAMAAGGALESTIALNGEIWGEIHALMNETPALPEGSKNHKIINAGSVYTDVKGQTKTFTVDKLPSPNVGNGEGQYPTYLSQLFDDEGFFAITTTDGVANTVTTNKSFKGKNEGNTAPQMLLLPDYFEWPQERKYIKEAYTKFSEWVEDVTKTDWILNSQEENLITDRGNLAPIVTPDMPSEVTESFTLKFETKSFSFTGSNGRTVTYRYAKCIELPEELLQDIYDNASAKLHLTFSTKESSTYYLDDGLGQEILKDNTGTSGTNIVNTYTLSTVRLQQALTNVPEGGKPCIWIVREGTANSQNIINTTVDITAASIDIHNVTTERHHKLFVNPTFMTFESSTPQQITASSSTGGKISYTSSDNSVATVSPEGLVTPISDGYASIVVRAESTTEDEYKATSERISVEVIMGSDNEVILNLGATQDIAGATGALTKYALCTTVRPDLSSWTNGATLTISNTAGENPSFQLRTANDAVVGATQHPTNKQVVYTLTAAQLDQFKNSAGDGYTFKVVHSEDTYVQAAILDKR